MEWASNHVGQGLWGHGEAAGLHQAQDMDALCVQSFQLPCSAGAKRAMQVSGLLPGIKVEHAAGLKHGSLLSVHLIVGMPLAGLGDLDLRPATDSAMVGGRCLRQADSEACKAGCLCEGCHWLCSLCNSTHMV